MQTDIEAISKVLPDLFEVLPEIPNGVWHRFSFDVCQGPEGAQVVHIRFAEIATQRLAAEIANAALAEMRHQGLDCASGGQLDCSSKIQNAILRASRDALTFARHPDPAAALQSQNQSA